MQRFFAVIALLLALAISAPAFAFLDGSNSGGTSTNAQTVTLGTTHDGDVVVVTIVKANQQTITPPSGYTEPSCGGTLPKLFNGTGNQVDVFLHTWHTGDTTTPVFNWSTAAVDNWITASIGAMSGGVDACAAVGNTTATTINGVDLGIPPNPNAEELMYYVALASADAVTSAPTLTTDGTTTAQHLIKSQASGTPSAYLYAISVGPKSPASDAGQPTLNITSTAVNAAVDILLTPAGPPAITAQSVTKTGSGHTLVSATNMALTMPSPVAGGLICIAHLAVSGNNIITGPAGWTKIRSDINGTASTQALFWHLTNGSEPASYSWNGGAGSVFYEGAITCYSGVNPTTPLDPGAPTGAAATGTGTSITAPSLTLQTAGDRVIGYFQDSETSIAEGATINLPASLTSRYTFTDADASYEAAASGDAIQIAVGATPALTATTTGGAAGDSLTGAQIALQPANMLLAGVSYPAGSTKRNASGLAYYSQIDATPVMGTTGACGASCAWQAPFVDIIAIYHSWFTTETGCHVYDWYPLDGRIWAARVAGKRISLGINALGNGAPTATANHWIFDSTPCTNSGQVDNVAERWNQSGYGPTRYSTFFVADPRDANYQHAADDMMGALTTRYVAISGPGEPIVSMHPLGCGGLGTIECTYYNQAENNNLNGSGNFQYYYANGNAGVDTANYYGTTTHEDFGSLNHTPGVMTVASMAAAQAHFEATLHSDFPNVQIINATVAGPTNLPQVAALLSSGGNGTIGQFNSDIFANDEATYPHQLVFEMYGGVGCTATSRAGSPGCFDGVTPPNNFLPAFNAAVGINFQTAINMNTQDCRSGNATCSAASTPWPCCSGAGTGTCSTLWTPIATSGGDCNVPTIMQALADGVAYYEAYPQDIADTAAQPWFQAFSNWANGRGQPGLGD